jgi:predicted glycosyltransferase
VTSKPAPLTGARLRKQLGIEEKETLVVASLGGGRVGAPLLEAVIHAFPQLSINGTAHLYVFTGPYMKQEAFDLLKAQSSGSVHVERFTSDFLSYLAAADLSVSMAGYNTCMNILAARVPALVWPFSQNREQGFRAERLAREHALIVLSEDDLKPERLAGIMDKMLLHPIRPTIDIDLDGAMNTARWVNKWIRTKGAKLES